MVQILCTTPACLSTLVEKSWFLYTSKNRLGYNGAIFIAEKLSSDERFSILKFTQ